MMVSGTVVIDFVFLVLRIVFCARNSAKVVAFESPGISKWLATTVTRRQGASALQGSLWTGEDVQERSKNYITSSAEIPKPKRSRRGKQPVTPITVADEGLDRRSKESTRSSNEKGDHESWHWTVDSDDFVLEYEDLDHQTAEGKPTSPSKLRFKVRGNPRTLQRHRSGNGHMYNPSLKYQRSFRKNVEGLLFPEESHKNLPGDSRPKQDQTPLFGSHEHLAMVIIFRMKRPNSHFVNSKPGPGRLKKNSPPQLSTIRTDVDNLTKFVLDSMIGILYEDDRQLASIHVTKLLDNEDLCQGSTEVHLRSIEADDLEKIIINSF